MNAQAKAQQSSADAIATLTACNRERAIKYGTEYANDYGIAVHFFSAPDYETEYVGGGVSRRYKGRLWLWSVDHDALGEGWRHEFTHAPSSDTEKNHDQ